MRRDLLVIPPEAIGRKHRAAVDSTIRAWAKLDHMTGPEHAGRRAVLRALAESADRAEAEHAHGQASAYSRARVLSDLAAHLDRWAPAPTPPRDEHAAELESAALAIIAAAQTEGDSPWSS